MNINRRRRFAIPSPATVVDISLSENRSDSAWLPGHHQDADLFVENSPSNGSALVEALRESGFQLSDSMAAEIERGKDFVQLKNGPFDLDLIFAPDGIERFADAWNPRVEVEGFMVCNLDDIIASKIASGRAKDRESLPRLESFREYLKRK